MRAMVLLIALAWTGLAAAAPPDGREAQARRHFSEGQAHYQAGRYPEALAAFQLGYALSPRPEFLINFAQVYRKLGQHERALVECERFLATAPPAPLAEQARRLAATLREEQARAAARARSRAGRRPAPRGSAPPGNAPGPR
jgi:tetratricopeptide (TPR) repeat protein